MQGISLDKYVAELHSVSFKYNKSPMNSFDGAAIFGEKIMALIRSSYGNEGDDFKTLARRIPLRAYQKFLSFDQLVKIRFSQNIMMKNDVEEHFRNDIEAVLVNKIQNSAWRWGYTKLLWNDLVDAHRGIKAFDLGLSDDFQVTLDHTTGYNDRGCSEYSLTYLDGVFAYLVHYRGEHVMTVGFSIISNRRILIQQIQLAKRTGNRFLFRFPRNRVEFIIDRFRAAFPSHRLFVVDGAELTNSILASYTNSLNRYEERFRKNAESCKEIRDNFEAEVTRFQNKIAHLTSDMPRLKAFYDDVGRYQWGKPLRINNLTHYCVNG